MSYRPRRRRKGFDHTSRCRAIVNTAPTTVAGTWSTRSVLYFGLLLVSSCLGKEFAGTGNTNSNVVVVPKSGRVIARSAAGLSGESCARACTRSGAGTGAAPPHCGVDLEISVSIAERARIFGLELGVLGTGKIDEERLRITALEEGRFPLELDYYIERNEHESQRLHPATGEAQIPHTLSVLLDAPARSTPTHEERPFSVVVLRLEACGLTPEGVLGIRPSVFVSSVVDNGVGWGQVLEADSNAGRTRETHHLWGVPGTFVLDNRQGGVYSGSVSAPSDPIADKVPRELFWLLREPLEAEGEVWSVRRGDAMDGMDGELEEVKNVEAVHEMESEHAHRQPMLRKRRLVEDCSAACLTHSTQKCYNDPDCEDGGLGCNALNDQLCRFCGFDEFEDCPDIGPTPAPAPTPAPTSSPNRDVCEASCLTSQYFTCYDDPSCRVGGLGCNAGGDFFCRFCGFSTFDDCPEGVGFTPAPTTVETPAPSSLGTPAPTALGTAAGSTAAPGAVTLAPGSFAPSTLAPGATTISPAGSQAPSSLAPSTLAPGSTIAPSVSGPTLAPSLTNVTETLAPVLVNETATPAPTLVASTASPSAGILPTAAPSAAPTRTREITMPPTTTGPTSSPTAGPTAAPTAGPTAAPSAFDTVGPTAAPTGSVLSESFVSGTISASGVSDDLIEEKGRDALVQEAVCTVTDCSDPDVIIVTPSSRRLSLPSMIESVLPDRSPYRRRLHARRRRLETDLVDVGWSAPSSSGEDEEQTGSQQAAAFFNSLADESTLQDVADALGIEVADLSFGDLTYYEVEGEGGPIENESGTGSTSLQDVFDLGDDEASDWATAVVAIILIGIMILLCCCLFCFITRRDKKRRARLQSRNAGSPPRKSTKLSTVDEEAGFAVEKNQMANRSMTPSSKGTLLRGTSQETAASVGPAPPGGKKMNRVNSLGSETSSQVSEKVNTREFTYTNPMHQDSSSTKDSPPKSYDDDLAQHYDGYDDARSDMSSELPHHKINNPLFSDTSRSPSSAAAAASFRDGQTNSSVTSITPRAAAPSEGSVSSEAAARSRDGVSWRTGESFSASFESSESASDASSFVYGGGAGAVGSGSAEGDICAGGSDRSSASRIHQLSSVSSSSRLGATPYGLSPVAETGLGGRGEGDVTSNSSAATNHHDSDMVAPSSVGTNSGMFLAIGNAGAPGEDDDDAQSLFRPSSPGAVSRPLQPLMAQQSPLSCGTQSAVTSRSNSFASPTALVGAGGVGGKRNIMWVPGSALPGTIAGDTHQKGQDALKSQESADDGGNSETKRTAKPHRDNALAAREVIDSAIKSRDQTGGPIECDKVRQAVRDAVRHHRKRIARSASHELPRMSSRRSSSSEMSTSGYPSPGAGVGIGSVSSAGNRLGGDKGRTIYRARSMSPLRPRGSVGSPEMGQLTSGSSGTSMSIDRTSSTDSGLDAIGKTSEFGPPSPILGRRDSNVSSESADAAAGASSVSVRTNAAASTAVATAVAAHKPSATQQPTTPSVSASGSRAAQPPTNTLVGEGSSSSQSTGRSSSTGDELIKGSSSGGSARSTGGGFGLKFTSLGRARSRNNNNNNPRRSSEGAGGTRAPEKNIFEPPVREDKKTSGALTEGAKGGDGEAEGVSYPGMKSAVIARSAADSGDYGDIPPPPYAGTPSSAVSSRHREEQQQDSLKSRPVSSSSMAATSAVKKLPASALRTSGSFGTRGRRSVSFADHSDSSDYDSRAYDDGRSHYGSGATLRQHLADPSRPSGSYRRQDSDSSSTFSEESLSPSYRGGGSESSFGSGTAYSTTGSAVSSGGYSVASSYTHAPPRSSSSSRSAHAYTYSRRHSSGGSSLSTESEGEGPERNGGEREGGGYAGGEGTEEHSHHQHEEHREREAYGPPSAAASTAFTGPSAATTPNSERTDPSTEYSRLFSPRGRGASGGGGGKRRMQMS